MTSYISFIVIFKVVHINFYIWILFFSNLIKIRINHNYLLKET